MVHQRADSGEGHRTPNSIEAFMKMVKEKADVLDQCSPSEDFNAFVEQHQFSSHHKGGIMDFWLLSVLVGRQIVVAAEGAGGIAPSVVHIGGCQVGTHFEMILPTIGVLGALELRSMLLEAITGFKSGMVDIDARWGWDGRVLVCSSGGHYASALTADADSPLEVTGNGGDGIHHFAGCNGAPGLHLDEAATLSPLHLSQTKLPLPPSPTTSTSVDSRQDIFPS